jgi:hypothetical protein
LLDLRADVVTKRVTLRATLNARNVNGEKPPHGTTANGRSIADALSLIRLTDEDIALKQVEPLRGPVHLRCSNERDTDLLRCAASEYAIGTSHLIHDRRCNRVGRENA